MSTKYVGETALQEVVTKTKQLVAGIKTITYEIVANLPTASATTYFDDSKTVYMVRNSASSGSDFYEEYITIRSGSAGSYTYSWEKIGDTQIDLSGYVPTSRKINNKALTSDITLTPSDIGAKADFTENTAFNKNFETTATEIKENGTQSVGSSNNIARADHIHPHDSTKQDVIDSTHKLSADNVDDTNTTNKFVTASDKTNWNGKQDALTSANAGDNITIQMINNVLKISAEKGVNEITDPTRVVMTDLDTGVYKIIKTTSSTNIDLRYKGNAIIGEDDRTLLGIGQVGSVVIFVSKFSTSNTQTDTGNVWHWFVLTRTTYISGVGEHQPAFMYGYTTTTNGSANVASLEGIPRGIKNNLTETLSGYALDARQGKALKDLIDALPTTADIPTKTSDLINDGADGTSTFLESDELVEITAQEVDALFS